MNCIENIENETTFAVMSKSASRSMDEKIESIFISLIKRSYKSETYPGDSLYTLFKNIKHDDGFIETIPEKSLDIIYDLLINNIRYDDDYLKIIDVGIVYVYYAIYYEFFEENMSHMTKYYLLAIDKGETGAMVNLGDYYLQLKEYQQMIKYYLMAVEKGNSIAMRYLGNYYRYMKKDHDLMKKYYLMAIDNDDSRAMKQLANYFQYEVKDYDLMEKCYLLPIEKGTNIEMITRAVDQLIYHYKKIVRDEAKIKEYLLIGANHGLQHCINELNHQLSKKFDVKFATKAYAYLDKKNLDQLNDILCFALKMAHGSPEIIYRFACSICKANDIECVFLKCGHPICYKCYSNPPKCTICGTSD